MKTGKLIRISDEALAMGGHNPRECDESAPETILANFRQDWQPADSREDALVQLMAQVFVSLVQNQRVGNFASISSFILLQDRLMKMQEFRRHGDVHQAA